MITNEIALVIVSISVITIVIMTTQHFQLYMRALKLMDERGESIKKYKLGILDFGSGGAIAKINHLINQNEVVLNEEAIICLKRSKERYFMVLIAFLPLVILFVLYTYAN